MYQRDMYDYFVLRPYRGNGIAEAATKEIFSKFLGKWFVYTNPTERNLIGQKFLRKIIKNYTNNNYSEYVARSAFEAYDCVDNKFDMLYSDTAFHLIPDEIGYKKVYRIIKNGGTIALFWNRPSTNDKDNPLHQKIQSIYNELLPQGSYKITNNECRSKYSSIINKIEQYGFTNIEFKLYHNTRKMTRAEYIELLNTYSDHLALEKSIKSQLFNDIRTVIEESEDELVINDTVDLYLAQKP